MAGRKRPTEVLLAHGPERAPRRGFSVELAVGVACMGLARAYGDEASESRRVATMSKSFT